MKESIRINDSVFIRHKITKTTRPSNIEKVLIKSKEIPDICQQSWMITLTAVFVRPMNIHDEYSNKYI